MKLVKQLMEVRGWLADSENRKDQDCAEVIRVGIVELRKLRRENKSLRNKLADYGEFTGG